MKFDLNDDMVMLKLLRTMQKYARRLMSENHHMDIEEIANTAFLKLYDSTDEEGTAFFDRDHTGPYSYIRFTIWSVYQVYLIKKGVIRKKTKGELENELELALNSGELLEYQHTHFQIQQEAYEESPENDETDKKVFPIHSKQPRAEQYAAIAQAYQYIKACFDSVNVALKEDAKQHFFSGAFWGEFLGVQLKDIAELVGFVHTNPAQFFQRECIKIDKCLFSKTLQPFIPEDPMDFPEWDEYHQNCTIKVTLMDEEQRRFLFEINQQISGE